jgi:hypothetical protein
VGISSKDSYKIKLLLCILTIALAGAPAEAQAGGFLKSLLKSASKAASKAANKVFKTGLQSLRAGIFLRAAIPGFGFAAASFQAKAWRRRSFAGGGDVRRLPGGGAVFGRFRRPYIFRGSLDLRLAVRSRPALFRRGVDLRPRVVI